MQTIDKLRKFAEGGKVRKYGDGGKTWDDYLKEANGDTQQARRMMELDKKDAQVNKIMGIATDFAGQIHSGLGDGMSQASDVLKHYQQTGDEKALGWGMAGAAVTAGSKMIDDLTMGDKNFGAQSQAIDDAIHGVSGALMKSGNVYAMVAAAALEGTNFLTKAGGQTVQGFDVDINSSGYGDLGHMESSSSRDFGAMIGLGGLNQGKMQAKLAKRNQQAMMAMSAANIANEQSFEQEARMNSVQNTIMNNQIALAGGMDTSLLGG